MERWREVGEIENTEKESVWRENSLRGVQSKHSSRLLAKKSCGQLNKRSKIFLKRDKVTKLGKDPLKYFRMLKLEI